MSFRSSNQTERTDIYLPADVHWDMLDKSKFFLLGAALFSGVSATLYPVMVLKTRQQVLTSPSTSSFKLTAQILRHEGLKGLYRGFPTSLLGTIPARVLYMSALEVTKSTAGGVMRTLGFSPSASAAAASAVGGIAASVAAQLVWTPVDVISQRLMVQGSVSERQASAYACSKHGHMSPTYKGGLDAFRCIVRTDGWRGLYRGFGLSIVTYAPSSALWWASYSLTQRIVWGSLGYRQDVAGECPLSMPSSSLVVGVQGLSAACAGGAAALVTTPLDTIKTRLQVENDQLTTRETVLRLVKEGGWRACYRGLGPRWAMMAMSAVTMITTYEFLKRSSKKSF